MKIPRYLYYNIVIYAAMINVCRAYTRESIACNVRRKYGLTFYARLNRGIDQGSIIYILHNSNCENV